MLQDIADIDTLVIGYRCPYAGSVCFGQYLDSATHAVLIYLYLFICVFSATGWVQG